MRQRSIHSIAHWTIMTLLLLFPVLMVGISSFARDNQEVTVTDTYQYQTNEVTTVDDLVVGNIYLLDKNIDFTGSYYLFAFSDYYYLKDNVMYHANYSDSAYLNDSKIRFNFLIPNGWGNAFYITDTYNSDTNKMYVIYNGNANQFGSLFTLSSSDYLGTLSTDVEITNVPYKDDINDWCDEFVNLSVNDWYQSLMNVMGIGLTNNSVMNVIYVMPLYIIWVFVLDLVVDIILVIVRLPHKALKKLGGENE